MKKIFILLFITMVFTACNNEHKVRILATKEMANIIDNAELYVATDTVVVYYSPVRGEWRLVENWAPFSGDFHIISGVTYHKAVIE